MKKIFFIICVFYAFGYAGAVCDYRTNDLQTQIDIAKEKHLNQKAIELVKKLDDFKKKCTDEKVIAEINNNIQISKDNLKEARQRLQDAEMSQNNFLIREAKINLKIAHSQYIANQQELLRMKDLLKK